MKNWFLWLMGCRVRSKITFECNDKACGHTHTAVIWHHPSEDPLEALQKQVQKEFEKQDGLDCR
jgi:hypothetical protein